LELGPGHPEMQLNIQKMNENFMKIRIIANNYETVLSIGQFKVSINIDSVLSS